MRKKRGALSLSPRGEEGVHITLPVTPRTARGLINFGFKKEEEGCS